MTSTVIIPVTSHTRYLSGSWALNIGAADPATGDWHAMGAFFDNRSSAPVEFWGPEGDIDTNPLLSAIGIEDRSDDARRQGIRFNGGALWAATHERAISDLLMRAVLGGREPRHLERFLRLDDYMPSRRYKQAVHDLLVPALRKLTGPQQGALRTWLARNPVTDD